MFRRLNNQGVTVINNTTLSLSLYMMSFFSSMIYNMTYHTDFIGIIHIVSKYFFLFMCVRCTLNRGRSIIKVADESLVTSFTVRHSGSHGAADSRAARKYPDFTCCNMTVSPYRTNGFESPSSYEPLRTEFRICDVYHRLKVDCYFEMTITFHRKLDGEGKNQTYCHILRIFCLHTLL